MQALVRYRAPNLGRSIAELAVTAGPLVLLWTLMWVTLDIGYWLCLLLAVPAAGFLVRLFMIQHDCGHGAFFLRRGTNDWVGRVLGVLTFTPYDLWRRSHAVHHYNVRAAAACRWGPRKWAPVRQPAPSPDVTLALRSICGHPASPDPPDRHAFHHTTSKLGRF